MSKPENPWVRIIKRGNAKLLAKAQKAIFEDLQTTLAFLQAMIQVGHEASTFTQTQAAVYQELIHDLREKFLSISPEKAAVALLAIRNSTWSRELTYNSTIFLFGSRTDAPKEQALASFNRLLDILDLYRTDVTRSPDTSKLMLVAAELITFSAISRKSTNTWEHALQAMMASGDCSSLRRLTEIFYSSGKPAVIEPIPLSAWRPDFEILEHDQDGSVKWNLPVPDRMYDWLKGRLLSIHKLVNDENAIVLKDVAVIMDLQAFYCGLFEDMWLEVMLNPSFSLRPDGFDTIKIEHPALKAAGYVELILYPEVNFPDFRARYIRTRPYGGTQVLEMRMTPADLDLIYICTTAEARETTLPILAWMDRFLAFMALRAFHRIVMGRIREDVPQADGNGGSNGNISPALIRPRFRRLPLGQESSPEARARARACFHTEPLPGFTFVRGYTRGENPNSGAPLFSLRESDLPQPPA